MQLKIDVWSDVMCPFCYIGKRKFEKALAQFEHKNEVELEWHSFQLDPSLKTQPDVNVFDYLAQRKNISREQSVQMHDRVTQLAASVGLTYNFDKAVVANSFNAHRVLQFAKTQGKGDALKENLMHAYFTEGKNTDDFDVLHEIGVKAGLDSNAMREVLLSDAFAAAVRNDEETAHQIGVRGVPFFLFNRKYAVSGAQDSELFLQALQQVYNETSVAAGRDANSCDVDGNCA